MAERLKSILRQIHWSLLVKACVFALAWFFLPFWAFFLVALYLYFIPLFQTRRLFAPFFILLILTYIEPAGWLFFFVFGAIFYYLLLIKDLLLIDRKSAYELLVVGLLFFLLRDFYKTLGGQFDAAALWYSLLVAILLGFLVSSFIRAFTDTNTDVETLTSKRTVVVWLAFLLLWQFLILGLFLPLDFVYQSVVIFLIAVLVIDFVGEYATLGSISRSRVLTTSATLFASLVIILASARWTL